jgi:hypothetical protein
MKRLKKKIANHVSPYMHGVVEDLVARPDKRKEENTDPAFLLAKQIFAERGAHVHESNAVYRFADAIRSGCYDYVYSIPNKDMQREEWIKVLDGFLAGHKIIGKKKVANKEKMIEDSYQIAKSLIHALPIVPRTNLIELLAQDIERGDFDDISPLENARQNWNKWVQRARQIMKSRNIVLDYR